MSLSRGWLPGAAARAVDRDERRRPCMCPACTKWKSKDLLATWKDQPGMLGLLQSRGATPCGSRYCTAGRSGMGSAVVVGVVGSRRERHEDRRRRFGDPVVCWQSHNPQILVGVLEQAFEIMGRRDSRICRLCPHVAALQQPKGTGRAYIKIGRTAQRRPRCCAPLRCVSRQRVGFWDSTSATGRCCLAAFSWPDW
jgi:hypothetical protein